MRFVTEVNTSLSLKDAYGRIKNEQILILAKSGYGKSLAEEGIVEELHDLGYIVLVIADPKDELEYGYAMFEPKEFYHLKELKKQGKMPSKKKVKIYHPFTFSIPNNYLPEIDFYTFNVKMLGRKEWSLIAESSWESEATRLLINVSQNLSKEDGIYGLLHSIQDVVEGKKEGKKTIADPKNFYLKVKGGQPKSMTEIVGYLQPFKRDYFLAKENCSLNLDWKDILSDQEPYHVFVNNWIKDDKLKEFIVLSLFNQIMENKNLAKKPLCIVIPEIRKLCPFKPQGYKLFLSEAIKENLSMMRSSGKGMTSILSSQVFSDIDEDVSDSATVILIGELGGARDMEKLSKAMNYRRDIRQQLARMEYSNSFLVAGREDVGGITMFFPSHSHCEENYSFFEAYKSNYPDKMKRYVSLVETMKKMLRDEENKFKERIKRKQREEKERKDKEEKEKEEESSKDKKVEEKVDKAKEIEKKSKEQLMKLCFETKKDNPEMSFRQIGKKFEINHITARNYIETYEKMEEEKSEENVEIEIDPDEIDQVITTQD